MNITVDGQWLISIIAAAVILLSGLGVMYLELPLQLKLKGHHMAKRMLASACFLVSAFLILLISGFHRHANPFSIRLASLILISITTFLIANFIVLLINPHALKPTHHKWQLVSAGTSFLVATAVILTGNSKLIKTIYPVLLGGYAVQLLLLTLFIRNEVIFYTNEVKRGKLNHHFNPKWIEYMVLYALCHGLIALVFNYFRTHKAASSIFIIIYTLFFLVVSLNYIRQSFRLNDLFNNKGYSSRNAAVNLSEALSHWVNNKGYLKKGITINEVATQIGTNRTYLSSHINIEKKKHFNSWINELRIAEAKWLLLNRQDLTIDQVGNRVGYTEQSNFTHHFTEITGFPPQKWRKIQMPENP